MQGGLASFVGGTSTNRERGILKLGERVSDG